MINTKLECAKFGNQAGRAGMSEMAQELVAEYLKNPTFKNVMRLCGAMKAVAQSATTDDYWREQVEDGHRAAIYKMMEARV